MQIIRSLPLLIVLSFNAAPLLSQNVNTMHPEEISAQKHQSPDDMRARAANVQLQKDAKELAELCASVSSDMDGVRQGLMSKDLPEKLKRVEKLSKQVRQVLAQTPVPPTP
jgi:Na+/phosphate symporter